jgi:hypothetical protein
MLICAKGMAQVVEGIPTKLQDPSSNHQYCPPKTYKLSYHAT